MKVLRTNAAIVLTCLYLVALRATVYVSAASAFWRGDHGLFERVTMVARQLPFFTLSLSFEIFALIMLGALAQTAWPLRWLSRGLLAVMLWVNCVGTVGYFTLRTYVKGFQLNQTNPTEVWTIGRSLAHPVVLATVLSLLALALLFGRKGSLERRPLGMRPRATVLVVAAAALVGVVALLSRPADFPTLAHSPVTLLLNRTPPTDDGLPVPRGTAAEEDWAPVKDLSPAWSALGSAERHFNIVLLVMESTRARTFWPSPEAPPLPHVQALAPHAVFFSRAYAHEPLSLKAFEALEFGTYPDPSWEDGVRKGDTAKLDTLTERWKELGMRTALIEDSLPLEDASLRRWGFTDLIRERKIRQLDPAGADRSLVKALDQFIDSAADQRFAAVIWTRETHYPYEPSTGETKAGEAPLEAYRQAVARIDDVVGDLTALLERRHLSDDTIVVLVGDHGEAFGEHPESGFVHGAWLFEESTHVPLMLINPRLFHGERDDRLVQQKDLAATLTWLAGDDRPNLNTGSCLFFDRHSESVYLANSWDVASLRGGMVRGQFKYMFARSAGDTTADERLYDLQADPRENHNLWASQQARGLELRDRFFGWLFEQRAALRAEATLPKPASRASP